MEHCTTKHEQMKHGNRPDKAARAGAAKIATELVCLFVLFCFVVLLLFVRLFSSTDQSNPPLLPPPLPPPASSSRPLKARDVMG